MNSRRAFSVVGLFNSAQLLLDAIPKVKTKVPGRLEAYTPFPVHGIDKVLGLRKSPIGGMVLVMGIIGAASALALEMWTSGIDYPQTTAGKPFLSWEAFVPIMFELTVLFATFTAGLGMLILLNRLPLFRHPMLRSKSLPLITRDKFGLAVEANGDDLDVDAITKILREAGAENIEILDGLPPVAPASPRFLLLSLLAIGISSLVAGYLTYWGIKLFPVAPPMVHMLEQPKLNPQEANDFFEDGFGMRMPVADTVRRGALPYTIEVQEDAARLINPLPRTGDVFNQGRQVFSNHCAMCHGILGDGKPTLTAAYGAKPANLVSQQMIDLSDGEIHHVIRMGKNAMPSYSADLDDDEQWAVVHYVRVLQRALNAKDSDIE
jgi:cytochrome c5